MKLTHVLLWLAIFALPTVVLAQDATETPSEDGGLPRSESGQILFVATNGDIYVVDGDGNNLFNSSNTVESEQTPVWTSDGTQIIFARGDTLYQMDANGGNLQTLLSADVESSLSVSLLASANGKNLLWGIQPTASILKRYFMVDLSTASLQSFGSEFSFLQPSWSPDGSELVFSDLGTTTTINIWNAQSGETRYLTDGYQPTWSPDGSQIAFIKNEGSSDSIFTISLEQLNLTQLTQGNENVIRLTWSPDGQRLAYIGAEATDGTEFSNTFIGVIDIESYELSVLIENFENIMTLAWSPNEDKIAFTTYDDGAIINVWDLEADVGIRIRDVVYFEYDAPAWRP